MICKKPSIYIYTYQPDPDFLREICAGIEEEGIFCEIMPGQSKVPDDLAFEAAKDSILGSGIGISGVDVAMQMQGLPHGKNVESYHMPTYEQCRRLGGNSARVVKKQGFKE